MKPAEPVVKKKKKRVVVAKRNRKITPKVNYSHVGYDPGELLGPGEFITATMPKRKGRKKPRSK